MDSESKIQESSRPESVQSENPCDQQFCLRWNNYQSTLSHGFEQLLVNESLVDVTLTTDQGQSVKCHKVVLSACSPYFQKLFLDNPCQHPIVILRDVDFMDLKSVIDYMYRGEVSVSQNQLTSILKAADLLKVRGLNDQELIKESSASEGSSPLSQQGLGNEEEQKDSSRPHKKRKISLSLVDDVFQPRRGGIIKTRDDLFQEPRK